MSIAAWRATCPLINTQIIPSGKSLCARNSIEQGPLVDWLEQRRNNLRFRDEALSRKVVSAA